MVTFSQLRREAVHGPHEWEWNQRDQSNQVSQSEAISQSVIENSQKRWSRLTSTQFNHTTNTIQCWRWLNVWWSWISLGHRGGNNESWPIILTMLKCWVEDQNRNFHDPNTNRMDLRRRADRLRPKHIAFNATPALFTVHSMTRKHIRHDALCRW